MKEKKSNLAPLNLKQFEEILNKLDKRVLNLTSKQKEKLIRNNLELKSLNNMKVKLIKISNILNQNNFGRSDKDEDFEDLEVIKNLNPVKVASIKGIKNNYILIDGNRRCQYLKGKGKSKIRAEVVGEAVCRSQISIAQAIAMNQVKKPLTNIQRAIGLVRLRRTLIDEFGKNAFFGHGGNRKRGQINKISQIEYIAQVTNMEPWAVRTLINFGRKLGTTALKGLLNNDSTDDFSLRKMQSINASIKREKLRKKIRSKIKHMEKEKKTKAEKIEETGRIALDFIKFALAQLKNPNNEAVADDNAAEDNDGNEIFEINFDEKSENKHSDKDTKPPVKEDDDVEDSEKAKVTRTEAIKLVEDLITQATELKTALSKETIDAEFPSDNTTKLIEKVRKTFANLVIKFLE